MKRVINGLLMAGLTFIAAASSIHAQVGSIAGVVTAAGTNQPLANAVVTARSDATGARSTVTEQNGRYIIRDLPPGSYTVSAANIGFNVMERQVQVSAGGVATADFALETQTEVRIGQAIVVTGTPEPIPASRGVSRAEIVDAIDIQSRPAVTPLDHLRQVSSVDLVQTGVQSVSPVVRGFNNVFSGALHALTDYRLASVPSLRVNLLHFVPATNDDIERMEVVLGPASALYGPNTANGVLHVITKSPLLEQGSAFAISGGERGLLHGTFRTSQLVGDRLGLKLSGQYLRADEWALVDTVEQATQARYASNPQFWNQVIRNAAGISEQEAEEWMDRVALRDNDLSRYSAELRADWRATETLTTIFTLGSTWVGNGIEQTGLGAAQAKDWRYTFVQARANLGRLFAQAYLNASDAGDTYLLRTGQPIVDRSKLWAAKLQHGFRYGARQDFTYGLDLFYTQPETDGTINGLYEDEDETTEFGGYIQSRTALTDALDLVLAGRIDTHSALPDPIFSPRAGLIYSPAPDHSFRATFNRAFSTPTSINQFLDLGTEIPIASAAALGYSVRVQGTGDTGFRFRQAGGGFLMRSPFTPGNPSMLVSASATPYWGAAVQAMAAGAAAAGQPIDPQMVAYLQSLAPTSEQIGTNYANPSNPSASFPIEDLELPDIDPIRESTSTTFEVGYQGVLGGRIAFAADAWYSVRKNFVTPLTTFTPFVLLRGPDVVAFLAQRFIQDLGMQPAEAQATAIQLATGIAQVPVGVISSEDVHATGAQLLATYTNVDDQFDVYGVDLSATALLGRGFELGMGLSLVNDHHFETDDGLVVTLNAPRDKVTLSLGYRAPESLGFSGKLGARYHGEYPVLSGVYLGAACIDNGETDPCVESFTMLDLTLGYTPPSLPGVSLDLSVQNLLDESYRAYPGMSEIGRLALLRLRYEFGARR